MESTHAIHDIVAGGWVDEIITVKHRRLRRRRRQMQQTARYYIEKLREYLDNLFLVLRARASNVIADKYGVQRMCSRVVKCELAI